MRHAIGLTFLALALPAWADDKGKVDEKLVGTWAVTAIESKGKTEPPPEGMSATFSKDGKFRITRENARDEIGTFKVDTKKTPKEIDLFGLEEDSEVVKAVYQIDGETIKLAMQPPGTGKRDRPTSFDSEKAITFIMKRQKP
jgi:uncharacterized protein (TIGR03067 family)